LRLNEWDEGNRGGARAEEAWLRGGPRCTLKKNNMKPSKTPARPPVDLDATDELPVLDTAAYEAELLSQQSAEPSDSWAIVSETQPDAAPAAPAAPAQQVANAAPIAAESEVMSAVERWIMEKTEELRAHHDALSLAQSDRSAAVTRAGALSRELAEKSAAIEALDGRERALAETLSREQEAAQRRSVELDAARDDAARLTQELADTRAAQARQSEALAASAALLEQRSVELQTLQHTHAALVADRQQAAQQLAALETRLRELDARERSAQRTIEEQNRSQTELTRRSQQESSDRERLATELEALQTQLASCLESLHSRESYRVIYESALQELDAELTAATARTAEQESRANQLHAELQALDRQLKDALRERHEARQSHDTEIAQRASERDEGERKRGELQSRLAEMTAKHGDAAAQLLAMEGALAAAKQRAETEGLASAAAAERLRELEAEIAARKAESSEARLETERNREMLADLTAALLRSQSMLSDQARLLEEREAAANTQAASHAEQTALVTKLRAQIEELSARLATPEAERRALEERLASLTAQAADSDSRLTHLESMNSQLRVTVGQLNTSLAEREAELQRATQIASMNAYALGRVQSSIDELGRTLTGPENGSSQAQVSVLTRLDNGQNHSVVLRGRTTIGRDHDNDLPLAMRSVSRHHAVLIPAFRTAFVQDLRSTNGVLVNQRRVRCARLEHGDMISFGEAQFRYTVTPAPAGAAPTASSTSTRHAHS
jgi:pSer/pThr/pTyr-binding forkhead associated (FHA) protein